MRLFINRRFLASFVFVIGLLLMIVGSAFLFGSSAEISQRGVLVSFVFVLLGIAGAFLAICLNKRSVYLFFAAFFLQVGIFLFLSALHIIPFGFSKAWPLLSVFSGIALIPTAWHRYGMFQLKYFVPSVAFIGLGAALMVFSLDLVSFSLVQFVGTWWPLLVVLAGLALMLVSLGTKNTGEPKR
jgi:hypothetical protein